MFGGFHSNNSTVVERLPERAENSSFACPSGSASKAIQITEPKEITSREELVKRSNGTGSFPHRGFSGYSFHVRPCVDRRPAGFVRRSVEKIEALLLCKK